MWDEYQSNAILREMYISKAYNLSREEVDRLIRPKTDSLNAIIRKINLQIRANNIRRMKQMPVDDIWLQLLNDLALFSTNPEQIDETIELYNLLTEEQNSIPLLKKHTPFFSLPNMLKWARRWQMPTFTICKEVNIAWPS